MPAGITTSGTLSDSKNVIVADARIVREYEGTWQRTCEKQSLGDGTGDYWQRVTIDQMAAQDITETTNNTNSQQYADTLYAQTVEMSQILIKITDRTYRRIASVVKGKLGTAAGNAMARKKNEDYLALFSTFSTAVQPGSGVSMSYGYISAAKNRITSNTTEASMAKVHTILHGFQWKDIWDEVVQIGTYPVPAGMTAEMFARGPQPVGMVAGSTGYEDGNIPIVSNNARGATHSVEAVIALQGMGIKSETRRDPAYGGGADELFMTDEYSFGEFNSAAGWAFGHFGDSTAPTS